MKARAAPHRASRGLPSFPLGHHAQRHSTVLRTLIHVNAAAPSGPGSELGHKFQPVLSHSVGQARPLRRLEGHCRCLFAHARSAFPSNLVLRGGNVLLRAVFAYQAGNVLLRARRHRPGGQQRQLATAGYLPGAGRVPILPRMFVVSEEAAAAIRTAYEQDGELSAAIELRRHFPGLDNAKARDCARTIAGWTPLPVPPVKTGRLRSRKGAAPAVPKHHR
jgi:hypothetical protein